MQSGNENTGVLRDFKLVLHGTFEKPNYMKDGPRVYEEESSDNAAENTEEAEEKVIEEKIPTEKTVNIIFEISNLIYI